MKRLLLIALLIGCPSEAPSPNPTPEPPPVELPDPSEISLDGGCALDDRHGRFQLQDLDAYTVLQGQVSDGVVPISVLEEIHAEGDCVLLRRNNPFCDPGCAADEACDFDGQCVPFPEPQDLGTVAAHGLAAAVSMEPVQPGFNYFSTDLPHPAMSPGETIRLSTSGGSHDPFALWGVGVEPLVLEPGAWSIDDGTALALQWEPPAGPSWSEIGFHLTIDQHGTSPVVLECAFDDVGSASIPATTIDALLDAGVSGWPAATLSRRTVDSEDVGAGCVELMVASVREGDVALADYIPCDADTPCPEPLTCDLAVGLCQ